MAFDPAGGQFHTAAMESTFLVKLTSTGAFVWGNVTESTSSPAGVQIESLAAAADGSIYVGGEFEGQVDFDPGPATANRVPTGYRSPFLLQLSKDGHFGWVATWDVDPAACVIYPGRIAASPTGGVWVGGSYGGTCDLDPGSGVDINHIGDGTGGEGFVLALDAAGDYVGAWTFGSWVADVASDSEGAVYAAGIYRSTVDFDPGPGEALRTPTYDDSSFTVKLSSDGAFQWVSTQTRFAVRAIALGPAGSVLLAGALSEGVNAYGVIELPQDQSLGWTVGFGSPYMTVTNLGATANGFLVGGLVYQDTDMDPGPGTDTVPQGSPPGSIFVSAYRF
jgi:hypothetical protein